YSGFTTSSSQKGRLTYGQKKTASQQEQKNEKAIARGHEIICTHPLFEALCHAVYMQYESMPQKDWAYV
ncbi:hypothetical protein, partial [Lysinibacillus fusiformis]|uniref:hypothetical protein n=1 Tax=Lysinibacillus fusiformis TaxID=28031 RepID=UPI0020BF38B3